MNLEAASSHRLSGRESLTAAQRRVGELAAHGATATEIAEMLGCSTGTVRNHLKAIYGRLGVASRLELARALDAVT